MSGIIVVRGYIGAHYLLEQGGQKVRKTERLNLKANGF
jgi:hypothetical protein